MLLEQGPARKKMGFGKSKGLHAAVIDGAAQVASQHTAACLRGLQINK